MSRYLQRSALLCLFAVAAVACSREDATSNVAGALPPVVPTHRMAPALTGQVTIEGTVTSIVPTPYFHVVVNVNGKGVSVYTSELGAAKVGYLVKATGFYNSLG